MWTVCSAGRLLRLPETLVGVECMRSLEMMAHFLVNNVKQNPLKVHTQSLRLGQAGMFTGAEL